MRAASAVTSLSMLVISSAKKAGCPAFLANGSVNCDILIEWLAEHPEVLDVSDHPNFELERALKTRAERMLKEHELELRQRSVIPSVEVKRSVTQAVFGFKRKLLAIPKRVSQILAAESDAISIEERLNEEIYDAMESLSRGEWVEQQEA